MKVIDLQTNQMLGLLCRVEDVPDAGKRYIWDRFVEKTNYIVVKDECGNFVLVNPQSVRLEQ